MLSMKPSRKALARPGRIKGSETVTKVCQRLARSVWAASSMDGLTPSTTPIITEGDRGEGEDLRDQQAGQTIDPSRRLDAD